MAEMSSIPIISVSNTAGLTAIEQLVNVTGNEIFSFKGSTSQTEETLIVFFPLYENPKIEVERKKFRFNWEGGLSEIKEKTNSVELQHKISEWR